MFRERMARTVANLRLGTGLLIVVLAAGTGLLAQAGVGFFSKLKIGPSNNCTVQAGSGAPTGAVTGSVCDVYLRTDGASGTILYVKATGTGTNTGWETAGTGGGSGGSGASPVVVVRKTADQSVTSSTTLVNDTHLFFNIAASEVWNIELTLFVDAGATGDLKIGLSVPSGATYRIARTTLTNTAGTIDQAASSTTTLSVGGLGAATIYAYRFQGVVVNSTTAGTVTLQFAQDTSDGTATTLKTNSVMVATPVGSASAAVTAGSFVLLDSKSIAGTDHVDFTAGFSSTYDDYEFHLVDVKPVVLNDDLLARFSTDGGATFDSTAIYDNAHTYVATNNTSAFAGGTGNTSMDFGGDADNAATAVGVNGVLHLIDPANTTNYKQFRGNVSYKHGTVGLININRSHLYRNTAAVNGVRFFYPGGNAAQGTIRMYGVAKSAGVSPGTISTGAWSARLSALIDGRVYLPSDGYSLGRDNGTSWATFGPMFAFTPPATSGWSWVNQGGATLATTADSQAILDVAASSGTTIRERVKTAPATPYTITAYLLATSIAKDFLGYGLIWRDSATGKLVWFNVIGQSSGVYDVLVQKYTNETTLSATYQTTHLGFAARWMRIKDDGVNRTCYVSADGQNWVQIHSIGHTDFITPDQVGFAVQSNNTTTPNFAVNANLLSWKEQ